MNRRQRVLVVDDDEMIRQRAGSDLEGLGAEVVCVEGGEAGLRAARERRPDVILLGVAMKGMGGFEVCRRLREDRRTDEVPVILMGPDDPGEKVKGFDLGASDYITRPFDAGELRARVRGALRTRALLEALEVQAQTDSLTGLPNRAALHKAITCCIERSGRLGGYHFAVLFLDLDGFKVINDSLGHVIGDKLLVTIAGKLRKSVREARREGGRGGADVVARMGGDEFIILLDDIDDPGTARGVAERLQEELNRPHVLGGYRVKAGVSIGIKFCGDEGESADMILRDSDTAMYHAKAAGKGRHVIFDKRMHEEAVHRIAMENDLRRAVDGGRFVLHYQPIITLDSGELLGFEALVRLKDPNREGVMAAGDFLAIAEETGLMAELGGWVLREACSELRGWQLRFPRERPLLVSVNLSKTQLERPGLAEEVGAVLRETGLEPRSLKLEVAESVIMQDVESIVPVLGPLRELGVLLAIDDLGTGYSSLASLHRFPIDVLKIDKAFIDNIDQSRTYAAIIHAIATLAHNLGMEVIAEGVETREQLVELQALECDYGQGYFLGEPVPAEAAEEWLMGRRSFAGGEPVG